MIARAQIARAAAGMLAVLAAALLMAAAPKAPKAPQAPSKPAAQVRQPQLEDFIAPPGTQQAFQPFMLHADLWVGLDRRLKLDSTVYALENGARCCRVLGADSLWAVDYTWIYPHSVFPPKWYDARELLQVGDSIRVPNDAVIQFTFGTCRLGVRAASYEGAHAEALRLWPPVMPKRLAGRLRLKLDRARAALKGEVAP